MNAVARTFAPTKPTVTTSLHARQMLPLDRAKARADAATTQQDHVLRKRVGELVGSVFYTHLIKEMQKTTFETKLMHGGRGEEVFKGQLNEEIGKRMGMAVDNPATERLYHAMKRLAQAEPAKKPTLEAQA